MQPDVHLLSSHISKIALYAYPCLHLCTLICTTLQAFFPNTLCAYINHSSGSLENPYSSCAHISNSYNISHTAFIIPTYIPHILHILLVTPFLHYTWSTCPTSPTLPTFSLHLILCPTHHHITCTNLLSHASTLPLPDAPCISYPYAPCIPYPYAPCIPYPYVPCIPYPHVPHVSYLYPMHCASCTHMCFTYHTHTCLACLTIAYLHTQPYIDANCFTCLHFHRIPQPLTFLTSLLLLTPYSTHLTSHTSYPCTSSLMSHSVLPFHRVSCPMCLT